MADHLITPNLMTQDENMGRNPKRVTLKALARHVQLTPGTVSVVLNNTPYSKAIPQHTKDRIFAAAQELNYHPNFFARTLRKKQDPKIHDIHGALVISSIEHFSRAVAAIRGAGLRVPEDVSVIRYED